MSYTPTNWQNGDTITAEKLNKLENGVAATDTSAVDINELLVEFQSSISTAISNARSDGHFGVSIQYSGTPTTAEIVNTIVNAARVGKVEALNSKFTILSSSINEEMIPNVEGVEHYGTIGFMVPAYPVNDGMGGVYTLIIFINTGEQPIDNSYVPLIYPNVAAVVLTRGVA